jgi:hypothetical protein
MITLVTGLWDIGRGNMYDGWSRSFQHYLDKFEQLLSVNNNMIIFGESYLEEFVWRFRNRNNTQFIVRNKEWFKSTVPYDKIQQIRNSPNWYNQSGWLKESTQGSLELYNPLVMSKMFLLHDAKLLDQFNSEQMFWIDAGITNTIHPGYFTHDRVLDKLPKYIDRFTFICFPYKARNEIHGFSYPKINEYANKDIQLVARGGLFGGPKETIGDINTIYHGLLYETINDGFMGTEESIFSIMTHKHSSLINFFEIEENGLISKFCEDLKNNLVEVKNMSPTSNDEKYELDFDKVGLYVITFNSPKQFETLIESMIWFDKDFLDKPKKYLLDNSSDLETTERYVELCNEFGFEHIKKDNLGITGGRQFIAEHFDETDLDAYFFFEDDMSFYNGKNKICKNGFLRNTDNLYQKSLNIIKNESFDYLKLNYTEFYGDNGTQFSWYNVPQNFRERHWKEKSRLPKVGFDPDAPKTEFKHIKSYNGLAYATGEIYLSNWPILLTKRGNYKCYLETKFAHPFEQTLMSHNYMEMVKGYRKASVLLLTPTEHNRFEHYPAELRKEC